ncbi:MAG: ParB/RepB/Spo0J family partition protein [Eubacterium sp.]|nr:ParB/RepB/Spo0J family partition protein [Eubacterium sp.]
MAAKKAGGLGKGLDTLIPGAKAAAPKKKETASADGISPVSVSIDKVEPNKDQPRKMFDEEALEELSDSIKKFGVLQPLLVQDKKTYYEIIAGERRWRAAKKAGLKEVPVIIKNYTEQEMVEISLIENIQRENLNPIEEAVAYKRLLEEFNLKQDEVAERVSKSRSAVTNSMRLLKLDERVQKMLIENKISSGHARALLGTANKEAQFMLAQSVVEKNLNVRDIEKLVKKEGTEPTTPKEEDPLDVIYQDMAEKLKVILGTKVSVNNKGGKGKIEIEYYSPDEFDRIVNLLHTVNPDEV